MESEMSSLQHGSGDSPGKRQVDDERIISQLSRSQQKTLQFGWAYGATIGCLARKSGATIVQVEAYCRKLQRGFHETQE
jgi:hypothetical protein